MRSAPFPSWKLLSFVHEVSWFHKLPCLYWGWMRSVDGVHFLSHASVDMEVLWYFNLRVNRGESVYVHDICVACVCTCCLCSHVDHVPVVHMCHLYYQRNKQLYFVLFWGHAGTPGVAFVSFANMESVLDERFFEDGQASWKLKMNSRVVGGTVTGEKKEDFSKTVVYTLQHIQVCVASPETPVCLPRNPATPVVMAPI